MGKMNSNNHYKLQDPLRQN